MPGSACLSRWFLILSLFALVTVAAEPSGHASTAVSIYTAASRVELLPTEANATEVVIHGAFMFINSNGGYSDAVCGTMYFRCPSGSETMCRMQWLDIRAMGTGSSQCAGFGAQNVVSTARVRAAGATPTSPDTWELGIGIQPGIYIDGKCAPAKLLACAQPPSLDGGAADTSISPDTKGAGDGVTVDLAASAETGAREAASPDIASAIEVAVDRAPSLGTLDSAPQDTARWHDVPGAVAVDAHVAWVQDGGTDRSAAGPPDASPDAMDDGPTTASNGCGCRLGGGPVDRHTRFPIGLVLFAALAGVAAIRRLRR